MRPATTLERKRRHIEVCLTEDVGYATRTTGFETYTLPFDALPETDLEAVDPSTAFLGSPLRAPILIGAMTGGVELAAKINRNLATAAQWCGVGMMLGSQRVMLRDREAARTFAVRHVAPDVLLIGNLGIAQLGLGVSAAEVSALIEAVGADALAVHTNPLQEALQPHGDTRFSGLVRRLREVTASVRYPIVLKEVGHGIGAGTARKVLDCGLAAIDVAGAGGTSWARVEQYVLHGEVRHPELAEWGIPTARALVEVRSLAPRLPLIASGGIRSGADAAKAIALGADVVAVARPLLAPAIESAGAVIEWIERFVFELRVVMHCMGAADLAAVRRIGVIGS